MFHGDLVSELHIEDAATHGFKSFLNKYKDKVTDPNLFVNFTSSLGGGDKRFFGQNRPTRTLPKDPQPHAAGPAFLTATPSHGDTVGMYGYPLDYVIKHPHDIVYGSDSRMLRVLRRTENCRTLDLQRAGLKDLQQVLDHLKIPASAGNFIEWWKKHGSVAYRKPTPGHMIWHLIQHDYFFKGGGGKSYATINWRRIPGGGENYIGRATVGQDEYTANVTTRNTGIEYAMIVTSSGKGGYKQVIPKTTVELDPTSPGYDFNLRAAVTATLNKIDKIFADQRESEKSEPSLETLEFSKDTKSQYDQRITINKLGWDAIQDTAVDEDHAVIYHGEPEQIVFVNKKGFEIENEFKLGDKDGSPPGGLAVWNLDDHMRRMDFYARKISTTLGDRIIERTRTPEGIGPSDSLEAIYSVLSHGTENSALAAMNIEQVKEGGLKRFVHDQKTSSVSRYYRTAKGWLHVMVLQGGGNAKAGHRYSTTTDKTGIAYEYLTKDKFEPAQGFYTTSKIDDVVADQHGNEDRHLNFGDKKIEIDPDSIGDASNKAGLLVRASQALCMRTHQPELSGAFQDCRDAHRTLKEIADVLGYDSLMPAEGSINDLIATTVWIHRLRVGFMESRAGQRLTNFQGSDDDYYTGDPINDEIRDGLREILGLAAKGFGVPAFGDDDEKRLVASMNKWVGMVLNFPVEVDDEMHKVFDLFLHLFAIVPKLISDFGDRYLSTTDSLEAILMALRKIKKRYPGFKVDPFKSTTSPSAETEVGGLAGESLPTQSETPAGSTPS